MFKSVLYAIVRETEELGCTYTFQDSISQDTRSQSFKHQNGTEDGKQNKEAYVQLRLLKGKRTFHSQFMPKVQLKLIHDKYAQYQFK